MRTYEFVPVENVHLGDLGGGGWTAKIEKILGDASEEGVVEESGGLLGNTLSTAYIEKLGQKLVSKSRRPGFGYKFDIVRDESPNAFALPNGSVFATVGLLRLLKSDAELANVLGHEVAHVTEDHTLNQIKVDVGAAAFTTAVSLLLQPVLGDKERESAQELVSGLITNGYSRKNEDEADKVGQTLAAASGWSPAGMTSVMQLFLSMNKTKPEGIEAYMQSHPWAGDRAKLAAERIPSLPKGELGETSYKEFLSLLGKAPAAPKKEAPATKGPVAISPTAQTAASLRTGGGEEEFPVLPAIFAVSALAAFVYVLFFAKK